MTILLRIADRVLNRPLLLHPDKLPLILAVLQGRIPLGDVGQWRAEAEDRIGDLPADARAVMHGPLPDASRFNGDFAARDDQGNVVGDLPYRRTRNGVALLPVIGALVNRGYSAEPSSMSKASYEAIKYQIGHAAADDRTTSAVLDLASPGGEAAGAFELAAAVRALAAKKQVTAVVNGMAASAAYAIASAATRIVTTPSGVSGSIGVVMLHADFSRALDKEGVTPTLIFAGAHKVDGHPFAPLPQGVLDDLQREVNQYYELFVQTVADGRRNLSPSAIRSTEARTFIGQEAVDMGLADSVGTFDEVLADMSRGSGRLSSISSKGTTMDTKTGEVAAAATISKAEHEALVQKAELAGLAAGMANKDDAIVKAKAEGRADGLAEGAKGERERIAGIDAIAVAGHDKLIADAKADGKTSPEQVAMAILKAEQVTRGKALNAIKGVEAEGSKVAAAPNAGGSESTGHKAAATDAQGWKAEYEAQDAAGAALRKEFLSCEHYVSFKKAEAAGIVKRLVNRTA